MASPRARHLLAFVRCAHHARSRALAAIAALVVAGCGSSSSSSHDMAAAASDMALPVCVSTLDAFCATHTCTRDLATAMQASTWCGDMGTGASTVSVEHCAGGQTVIVETFVDNANDWVYANGTLVAVFAAEPHATSTLSCEAGPMMFAAPTGCDAGTAICS